MRRYEFPSRTDLPALLLPLVPTTECARLLDACTKFVSPLLRRLAMERGYRLTVCDIEPETPEVVKVDITQRLPWPDHYFRGAISADTLEHIELHTEALREFYRVTEPHGFLMLHLPVQHGTGGWQGTTVRDNPGNQHKHVWAPGLDFVDRAVEIGYTLVGDISSYDADLFHVSKLWLFVKDAGRPWDKE